MDIAPDTLRDVLAALTDAQVYVSRPTGIRTSGSTRTATHRVPHHEFEALNNQLRTSIKTLSAVLRTVPS